ncbi:MAG: hypothetical protein V4760_09065 [Bdellovibrionota bacterium]
MLTTAFNWLQTQPDSIRKMATSPDALVCLYTRAQRMGNVALDSDAPVSSQVFMSDLKNLAEGLRQFDEPTLPGAHKATHSAPLKPRPTPISAQMAMSAPVMSAPATQPPISAQAPAPGARYAGAQVAANVTPLHQPVADDHRFFEQHQPVQPQLSSGVVAATAGLAMLNERSLAMIQEVKAALNLSSDSEVANLMVALAYKNLKTLLA